MLLLINVLVQIYLQEGIELFYRVWDMEYIADQPPSLHESDHPGSGSRSCLAEAGARRDSLAGKGVGRVEWQEVCNDALNVFADLTSKENLPAAMTGVMISTYKSHRGGVLRLASFRGIEVACK